MNDNQAKKAVIGPVRFSYLHVFEPWAGSDGTKDPQYSVCIIVPKSDRDNLSKLIAAYSAAYEEGVKTKGHKPELKNTLWKYDSLTHKGIRHDGDIERAEEEAFKDSYYFNLRANTKPGVVKINPSGNPRYIPITNQDELYSGCYGYVSVGFFAYKNSGNTGVSIALNNLLKTSDGEYLGGRSDANTDFAGLQLEGVGAANVADDDLY